MPSPPVLIFAVAAALQIARIDTGWTAIDEFAGRLVYFFAGYAMAPRVFALAAAAQARPAAALAALAAWAALNGTLVAFDLADLPGVALALGFLGAGAVIAVAALMARAGRLDPIRFCGAHSIVIYLGFFLPMAASRTILLKTGAVADVGIVSLVVTAAGVLGALLMWWAARHVGARFLYERPDCLRIAPRSAVAPPQQGTYAARRVR